LIGGLIFVRGFFMLLDAILNRSDPGGVGYQLGGAVVMFILGAAILNWGGRRFRTVPLPDAVVMLRDKYATERRWAAKALSRAGWVPTSEDHKLDFPAASEKWDDLEALGSIGIDRICEALTVQEIFIPPLLLTLGRSKNLRSVKPLIKFLDKSKSGGWQSNVIKALKEITDKDFGDDRDAWTNWFQSEVRVDNSEPRL